MQNYSFYISKFVTGPEFQLEQVPWLEARVAAPIDFCSDYETWVTQEIQVLGFWLTDRKPRGLPALLESLQIGIED